MLLEHIPVHSIIILRSYNDSFFNFCLTKFALLDPVIQKVNNAIHGINLYPLDNAIGVSDTYPLGSDPVDSAIGVPDIYLLDSAIHLLNNWGLVDSAI